LVCEVIPLWEAKIADPAEVPKEIPFAFENDRVWKLKFPFDATTFWLD